jgi:hypothetical protein
LLQWVTVIVANRAGSPTVRTTAATIDQRVERSDRSFVHSETIARH